MSRVIGSSLWSSIQYEGESMEQFRRRSMLQNARETWMEARQELAEMDRDRPWWEDFTPLGAT